jgi:hypothetical protein
MTDLAFSALALLQQGREGAELPAWLSTVQALSQIVQSLVVALATVAGAIWALYVFVLARNTTANVHVDYSLKNVVALVDGKKVAVVTVSLTNTGRTQVLRVDESKRSRSLTKGYGCTVTITPIIELPRAGAEPYHIHLSSIDEQNRPYTRKRRILENLVDLQPGEEATEDVLFAWSSSLEFGSTTPAFKIEVQFTGSEAITLGKWRLYTREPRMWTSRGVLEARAS